MKAKFAVLLCMLLCLCVAGSVTAYAAGSEIESVITFTQQGEPDSAPVQRGSVLEPLSFPKPPTFFPYVFPLQLFQSFTAFYAQALKALKTLHFLDAPLHHFTRRR